MMRPAKSSIITVGAILSTSFILLLFFYGNAAVYVFGLSNNMNIAYVQLKTLGVNEFVFKGLRAVENKRGMGFLASDARIKLLYNKTFPMNPTADLTLRDVRLISKSETKEASYINIDGLIAAPFSGLLKYNTVSAKIASVKEGINIRDFLASADDLKFSFDGLITDSGNINADIAIYFAKSILGKIPPELSNMVLKDSEDQWKSFSVKLEGDLAKPAIKVTGKLFRLNIGVK